MRKSKWSVAISALIAAIAALAFAVPAQADDSDGFKGECVITGDADAVVPLSGGKGTYTFNQLEIVCAGVEMAKGLPSPVAVQLDVESEGKFANAVCGTGKASDEDDPSTGPNEGPALLDVTELGGTELKFDVSSLDLDYHIDFAAGQGLFYFTGASSPNDKLGDYPPKPGDPLDQIPGDEKDNADGDFAGVISISPDSLPNPETGTCTTGFTVTGAITLDTLDVY